MVYRLSEAADSSLTDAISVVHGGPARISAGFQQRRADGQRVGTVDFVRAPGERASDLDMHIEPGGGVPVWLARQRIVGTPTQDADESRSAQFETRHAGSPVTE